MSSTVLTNTDRILLNPDNRKQTFGLLIVFYVLISVLFVALSIQLTNHIYFPLGTAFGLAIIFTIWVKIIRVTLATGYIKSDVVILKLLSEKAFVLEFICIKKARSLSVLGLSVTFLKFKFDGVEYHTILCGKPMQGGTIETVLKAHKRAHKEQLKKNKP
ncbi:hypothetical protein Fluta_1047 [Fluviicola taffensis DSM 16823]|uniref:Uncharacterized protein n=1 Tax=Fluviicola taffensis (strain DSM 16823 / NCIMB 13979 / RW262) TaxID=755732 RepID=F2I9P9_FLUTR|nr:hypothetical protein Fluta_1047 [Fluviicola taffensis DSM 16823]